MNKKRGHQILKRITSGFIATVTAISLVVSVPAAWTTYSTGSAKSGNLGSYHVGTPVAQPIVWRVDMYIREGVAHRRERQAAAMTVISKGNAPLSSSDKGA